MNGLEYISSLYRLPRSQKRTKYIVDCAIKDIFDRAVLCQLFQKPVLNLLQKTVGYRLTFIQSSDLYFLSIHTHVCHSNVYVVMKQIHSSTIFRKVVLSYSELLMIIKGEVRSWSNLISEERVKFSEQNSENLMKIGWKIRKLWNFESFANFQETFLDQSVWICKWVSWWCHRLTTCHIFCT